MRWVLRAGLAWRRRAFSSVPPHASLLYVQDVITVAEEQALLAYVDPMLNARRYEKGHWDSVIAKYKEIEIVPSQSPPEVRALLRRLAEQICQAYEHRPSLAEMQPPHVVDLAADGFISPHVDNIKHSGAVLAGLSLLSPRVMRLEREADRLANVAPTAESVIEKVLQPRSLYMLKAPLRYDYAHSILGAGSGPPLVDESSASCFAFERRISVVFRDRV